MEAQLMTPAVFKQYGIDSKMKELGMNKEAVLREIGFACQIINGSTQLQKTDLQSRLRALVSIVGADLTLNPLAKEMYLIPRWDKHRGGMVCCAEPSYTGLLKLITDGGAVSGAVCHLVYENDTFEPNLATGEVSHIPKLRKKDRGEVIGAYALATLLDGTKQMEWMDVEEINEIRATSESYKYWEKLPPEKRKGYPCFWVDYYGEMARKTVMKRLIKWLPRSAGKNRPAIDKAIELSNSDFNASDDAKEYARGLLRNSGYDVEMRSVIDAKISSASPGEISNIITDLQNNQLNPVTHGVNGGGYNQGDIHRQLERHI